MDTINSTVIFMSGWTLFESFAFLVLDFVLYFILGVYFDQVATCTLGCMHVRHR